MTKMVAMDISIGGNALKMSTAIKAQNNCSENKLNSHRSSKRSRIKENVLQGLFKAKLC